MITVEFKDFEDMVGFAANLVSTVETREPAQTAPVTPPPVQQAAPVMPPPVQAQQTTPMAAPVQPATPVTPPPVQQAPVAPPPVRQAPVQTAAPSYTADDLARAAMTLMDSGRQGELISLLAQFGTDALTQLPPEQYGAFATALRGLGAPI